MGLLKIMGVAGSLAGVLLSASVAFAESNDRVITSTTTKSVKVEAVREEAKARMENAREEAKTRVETAREEAKQRLGNIRDKEKKQKAERLTEQFDKLNKKWTDHFIQLLERYEAVLVKIQERADIAAGKGRDTVATNEAIQSAKTAIENARTAVVAQASKTYALDTSALANTTATATASGQDKLIKSLRTEFQTLHKALFKDLYALRDGVMKDARTAVQSALRTLSQIPKVDDNSNQ